MGDPVVVSCGDEEGPAAEAEALEFDKIDLGWRLARSCLARGLADLQATASAADPYAS